MGLEFINVSGVMGGQEIYLEHLAKALLQLDAGIAFDFFGSPENLGVALAGISGGKHPLKERTFEGARVRVFNGNRALYQRALLPAGNMARLYIQHSSLDDAQSGSIRPWIRRRLLRLLLRRMDAVIRVSRSCLPDEFAPGKIHTVPNGVDLARFPCRTQWRRSSEEGPLRLLMVGALTPNKNQQLAIRALASWPQAELTLVGEGPARSSLESLATDLGVSQRVHFMGWQTDTAAFYREADACMILSQHEAAPFALLEAMASGTPVMSLRVGGVPEVVAHAVDGCLLPAPTVDALHAAWSACLSDPQAWADMGRKAREKMEGRYTVMHMAKGFLEVVDAAIARRKGER